MAKLDPEKGVPTGFRVRHLWSTKRGQAVSVAHKVGDIIQAEDIEVPTPTKKETEVEALARRIRELVGMNALEPVYEGEKRKKEVEATPVTETLNTTGEVALAAEEAPAEAEHEHGHETPAKRRARHEAGD